ncbi:phosphotransferase family protein [Streptomyces sp. NRRL F-5126]|uniref:phosphotransferase family protein n=1 Tax=Streptomyces sp. NRRL F-5126 TaxID=1463857 RepID=UPI0004C5B8C0|nr:phosphotransferase [Streptomyces sp. NRRL F-5126]
MGPDGQGGEAAVAAVLEAAGVADPAAARVSPLSGGTYNTVVRVTFAGGREWVVKIPPPAGVPGMGYERGLLRGEAAFYRAASAVGAPVPEIVHAAFDPAPPVVPHVIMTARPGVPWPEHAASMTRGEERRLRHQVGREVARLHAVTGPGFGYPAQPLGPLSATWRQAFRAMSDAVLADAVRYRAWLPETPDRIHATMGAASDALDEVVRPALVHFDLWQGNLLLDGEPGSLTLGGIIDGERMFWGDPAADFVSLALFADIERETDFLAGYAAAGGRADFDASLRLRVALYRCYLYLIMLVEAVPRGYPAEQAAWTRETVGPQLEAALRDVRESAASR